MLLKAENVDVVAAGCDVIRVVVGTIAVTVAVPPAPLKSVGEVYISRT